MSIYSGSSKLDPNKRRLVDLVTGVATDDDIRKILNTAACCEIGMLTYTANISQPVQKNVLEEKNDLPDGFNGWLYANGSKISKKLFGKAYEKFKNMTYPGKESDENYITIPNITKFFKLISKSDETPYIENAAEYAMPSHVHDFESIAQAGIQTIKRCAYIWSTRSVNEKASGGKMRAISGSEFKPFGGVSFPDGIPAALAVHRGAAQPSEMNPTKFLTWDIPIDSNYGFEGKLECNTGKTGITTPQCWPDHVCVPVMVYVGKAD